MSPSVAIQIVTCNSERHFEPCLESLEAQTCRDFAAVLWDNASGDGSAGVARRHQDLFADILRSETNVGFSAAHNRLLSLFDSDYVLVLNPDVVLEPHFIEIAVKTLDRDPAAGSLTGKLWRWEPSPGPRREPAGASFERLLEELGSGPGKPLDTTGIFMTQNQRHLDRGSGEADRGQYDRPEYVFGASGAAAFYRREMLEDVKSGGEVFAESFFAYREDADLAWRAQWLGWRCIYTPEATGLHVRRVLPERRRSLPADINMHSFKNRFLLRVRNMDAGTYARHFAAITGRDLTAFAYVLVRERSSLRGIPLLLRTFPRDWAVRRDIMHRRRVTPRELRFWFCNRPAARPADG